MAKAIGAQVSDELGGLHKTYKLRRQKCSPILPLLFNVPTRSLNLDLILLDCLELLS